MIDMNQSIENIMEQCDRIAFNEFKSDIEASYSVNRAAEKLSGSHEYGKAAKNAAKIYNARGYITHKQNADNTKNLADNINAHGRRSVDSVLKDELRHEGPRKDYNKFNNAGRGRGLKEECDSASIFDTLLDQV